jgi:hypothetical protein
MCEGISEQTKEKEEVGPPVVTKMLYPLARTPPIRLRVAPKARQRS